MGFTKDSSQYRNRCDFCIHFLHSNSRTNTGYHARTCCKAEDFGVDRSQPGNNRQTRHRCNQL